MSASLSNLYHWCRQYYPGKNRYGQKYCGPTKGVIVYADRITELDFTKHESTMLISQADGPNVVAIGTLCVQGWSLTWGNPCGGTSHVTNKDLNTAVEQARVQVQAEIDEEAAIKADPVKDLERCLQRHDWTYQYSDDHRYWVAGEASARRIQELMEIVPEKVGRALFKKYKDKK